jgi:RNA polymerase sigma-70 factor (ECF subfamily)
MPNVIYPATEPPSDEQLAVRAQRGCEASFEQLVRRLQVPLVQFLLRWTTRHADAEDLAQDTFVRAFRNLDQYSPQWRFRTWLFTIAQRLSINGARRQRPEQASPALFAAIPSQRPDAAEQFAARESAKSLWDTIGRVLDREQAAALWLHYVEELSTAEMGQVLGRSRVAVKTMLFRARQRLLPHLKAEFAPDDHAGAERDSRRRSRECVPEVVHA